MGGLLTINKSYPYDREFGIEIIKDLLSIIKGTIKELKYHNPELKGYKLYDVGFKPNGSKIDIKFYFLKNEHSLKDQT